MIVRNPQPMMMMPFPFGMSQPQQQPTDSGFSDRIPARVLVAISYIDKLAGYSRPEPVAIACDIATEIQVVPGQKLEVDQLQARQAACNLLVSYFNGELKLAEWEKPDATKDDYATKMKNKMGVIRCPACGGQRSVGPKQESCQLCNGGGALLIAPAEGD